MRRLFTFLAAILVPAIASAQAVYNGPYWHAEDSAHTSGQRGVMVFAVRDDAATVLAADGDYIPLTVNSAGALVTTCTLSSGTEDAAETAGGALAMVGTVRRDTAASSAGTTGDNATLNTDANGRLYAIDAASGIEDAAETAGGYLAMAGSVRRDTLASSAGTTGDNATLNTDANGALYVIAAGGGAITCGNTDVPSSGTAVQLGANTCKKVVLSCPAANTSPCYVRGSAGNGVTGGMVIPKSTSVVLEVNNTNLLFVDAGTNADDVTWCCTN